MARVRSAAKLAWPAAVAVAGVAALLIGLRAVRSDVTSDVYRARLGELTDDYNALRSEYNAAVARTAVTELIV